MVRNNQFDNNELYYKIERLISEGELILNDKTKDCVSKQIEWLEKVNIINERYLKNHPSYHSIYTVYFHASHRHNSMQEMLSKLRAILKDNEFFEIEDKSGSETINNRERNVVSEQYDYPQVFISYSWDDESHKKWVRELADNLLAEGVQVIIDQYDMSLGSRLTSFMERGITECDYVLIICTPQYKAKADNRLSGVGYESNIITGDLLQQHNELKYIPVLRAGDYQSAMPTYMSQKLAVDLRESNPKYDDAFQDLLTTIRGETKKPPVFHKRSSNKIIQKDVKDEDDCAFHITGIITDEVTLPRNDGTKGSALYSIPFRLSGSPPLEWCDIFIDCWNHPSSFTTMHRPGIASVNGDKIILNGTTIEEVQKYHRDTLVAAVKRANELLEQLNQKKAIEQEQRRLFEEEHNKTIENIASTIDFNE